MSFLFNIFQPGLSVISGALHAVTNPIGDITNTFNGIQQTFGCFIKTLQSIPSDIQNFFSSIAGGIVTAFERFGAWVYGAFATLGDKVSQMLSPLAHALHRGIDIIVDFINGIVTNIVTFVTGVVGFISSELTGLHTWLSCIVKKVETFLSNVFNDFVQGATFVSNIIGDIECMFNDVISFISTNYGNLVNDTLGILNYHNDSLPFNLLTQEASKIATAFDNVLDFNVFMETLKSGIRDAFNAWNLPLSRRILLMLASPILGAVGGMISKIIFNSFYPNAKPSTVFHAPQYNTTPPSVTLHTLQQTPSTPTAQYTPSTPSAPSIPPSQPSISNVGSHTPKVISVGVFDLMTIGQSSVFTTYGIQKLVSQVQYLSDELGLDDQVVWSIMPTVIVQDTDSVSPTALAEVLSYAVPVQNVVEINASASVGRLVLPPGESICKPLTTPQSTYTYGDTATNDISVEYSYCFDVTGSQFSLVLGTQYFGNNLPNAILYPLPAPEKVAGTYSFGNNVPSSALYPSPTPDKVSGSVASFGSLPPAFLQNATYTMAGNYIFMIYYATKSATAQYVLG
jgi:hypothetical protein